jgi:hypothetical protein
MQVTWLPIPRYRAYPMWIGVLACGHAGLLHHGYAGFQYASPATGDTLLLQCPRCWATSTLARATPLAVNWHE